ncbi:MAG: DNA/RNA nuclease SfsA [Anaerolineales bacterium]
MDLPELLPGTFVQRDNRFRATVLVDGRQTWAFVPNSGRLTDLFTPDRPVWLHPAESPARKTDYDLVLVEHAGVLVSVDARLPNPLFEEYLQEMKGHPFEHLGGFQIHREVMRGESRLDFQLQGTQGACWVETKSVTLVEDGTAYFTDATTSRGRRHVADLAEAVHQGDCASVVFVVQRPDAASFSPYREVDPQFATLLKQAAEGGVDVRAFTCQVSLSRIRIDREIPCRL